MSRWLILPLFWLSVHGAMAAIDAYPFPDDSMRERYHALIDELRCPQCLNTNLAGSDAMIAQDLRREVHRLILEGKTDQEVRDFMFERYGDFILYEPRLTAGTLALWFMPFLLLVVAAFVIYRLARKPARPEALSPEEAERINQLIDDKA